MKPRILEWTIPVSSISKLKKVVTSLKGDKGKGSNKPKVQRKRRRADRDDDSSSDESEIPKPIFNVNDEDDLIMPLDLRTSITNATRKDDRQNKYDVASGSTDTVQIKSEPDHGTC
jgi:hypothetical protein